MRSHLRVERSVLVKTKEEVNEIINTIKEMEREFNEKTTKYLEILNKYNTRRNLSNDEQMALVLVSMYDRESLKIPVDVTSVVSKILEDDRVREILSKTDVKTTTDIMDSTYLLPLILVLTGRITIKRGHVELNGKPLEELIERKVVNNPKIVARRISIRLKNTISTTPPSVLSTTIGGRVLWSILPRDLRDYYIRKTTIYNIKEILENPDLRNTFREHVNQLVSRYLRDGDDVNFKTKLVLTCCPQIVEATETNVVETPTHVMVKHGPFLLQIWGVTRDGIQYILYRDGKKVGFVVEATSLKKALVEASLHYDNLIWFYDNLKKADVIDEQALGTYILPLYKTDHEPVSLNDIKTQYKRENEVENPI